MDGLKEARERIENIDCELQWLFLERMRAVGEVAKYKSAHGLCVHDPEREGALTEMLCAKLPPDTSPELSGLYRRFLEGELALSKEYQRSLISAEDKTRMHISLGERGYDIHLIRGGLSRVGELLELYRRVLIVSDTGVPVEYAEAVALAAAEPVRLTLPEGEGSKSPENLLCLLKKMQESGFDRGDAVVAVGGGMVGDIAGLAASLYMRGIDFYNIPTTLLSMVDASVGGKTAVDLGTAKNMIGCFYQPRGVLIDADTLKTLPKRQLCCGYAEAMKMGLTSDAELFYMLERGAGEVDIYDIIRRALAVKISVVERDERESGLRRVLNFGHTLGHAIEASSRGKILHGEAVALGMLPMCPPELSARILQIMERLGMPITPASGLADIADQLRYDKKRSGNTYTTVTVTAPGSYSFTEMTSDTLISRMKKNFKM